MVSSTSEAGKAKKTDQVKKLDMAYKSFPKNTFTKANSWTAKSMEQASWNRRMATFTMANGLKASKMGKVCITTPRLKWFILANGKMERKTVLEFWSFHKTNTTKAPLSSQSRTGTESKSSSMEISTKANTEKESSTAKESTHGPTLLLFRAIFVKAWDMVTDLGNLRKSMATFTLAHIKTTKRAVTEDTSGRTDAYTKETLQKTSSNFVFISGTVKGDWFTQTASR